MNALTTDRLELYRPGGFRLGPVTLSILVGSRTALVGRSGAGKSTLLRCIAGLETPSAGALSIGDRVAFDGRERLAPHERKIGFVFQGGGLWPHLDSIAHLRFVAPHLEVAAAKALLARVGLAGKEARKPSELSGGEAQRLALARALATKPSLLLLDEPLRSLDVHLRVELCLLIRSTVAETGTTLLAVTHDREEALMLADRAIVLDGGRIVEEGPIERIALEPRSAHGAALLAQATCLEALGDGSLETAFGTFQRPVGLDGNLALAIIPGDVTITTGDDGVACRVLYSESLHHGSLVHVELARVDERRSAVKLVVPHDRALAPDTELRVRLTHAPRFLRIDSDGDT